MDVKKPNPVLNINFYFTIDVVFDEFSKSDIAIDKDNYKEVWLYLSLKRKEKYLARLLLGIEILQRLIKH